MSPEKSSEINSRIRSLTQGASRPGYRFTFIKHDSTEKTLIDLYYLKTNILLKTKKLVLVWTIGCRSKNGGVALEYMYRNIEDTLSLIIKTINTPLEELPTKLNTQDPKLKKLILHRLQYAEVTDVHPYK